MSTSPWDGSALTIIKADGGATLSIRKAQEGDNPNMVFTTKKGESQLEDLFATLAASGLPVKSSNFVLYGTERGENGYAKAIAAAIKKPYEKDGETLQGNYAYSPKQIDAFVPVSFAVVTKWQKGRNGKFPAPLLLAHALPYERTRTTQDMGFQRVTNAKVNDVKTDVAPVARVSKGSRNT